MTTSIVRNNKLVLLMSVLIGAMVMSGCGNLRDQPKYQKPYDESELFGSAARVLDDNAVPVGFLNEDELLAYGTEDGEYGTTFPFEITEDILQEGRRQYEGFCSPCHGYAGYGNGVVALEGYPQGPASYHTDRLRDAPNGYYFDVITNGQGAMYSYGARINPENRWAIIAYIRAMQFSQEGAMSNGADTASTEDGGA